jgi:hypothetical protein
MIQVLITVIIVVAALAIAIYKMVTYLRNPLRQCEGCGQSCGGCELEELKKKLDSKGKTKSGKGSLETL